MLQWLPIIGPVIEGVAGWFRHKQVMAEQKQESALKINEAKTKAVIDQIAAGQMADINWDQIAQANSGQSWKDEWFTIVLSIPAIMCFIPGLDGYVFAGFAALEKAPDWYEYALLVAIAASFGFRELAKWKARTGNES